MRRYFLLGDPTELYSMSDSETSTAAGMSHASTPARPTPWSRKHAKIEKAARMRSKTQRTAVLSGDPAMSTTPRDDRMTSDQEESDARGSTARPLPVHSQTPAPVSSDRGRSDARGSSARPLPVKSQTPAPVSSDQEESDARGPTARPLPVNPETPAPVLSSISVLSPTTFSLPFSIFTSPPAGPSLPWSRKQRQRERAEKMRCDSATMGTPTNVESEQDNTSSDEEFSSQEVFDDWMVSLRRDQRRILAVIIIEHFKNRLNLNVKAAATEAESIVGFNEKTIRQYRNDFFENECHFTAQLQGKYERQCVHNSEDVNHKAAEWVREHAFVRGEPNMTAQSFCSWVNDTLLPSSHLQPHFPRSISLQTGVRWLHHLGFKPVNHKKGVYIDGHEREDVVHHRKSFLKSLGELRASYRPPPPCSDEPPRIRSEEDDEKEELVVIYHDESTFNTNEGQTWIWGEDDRPAILPKTKGSGIMVSDFVEEHGGFLQLTDKEFVEAKQQYPAIEKSAQQCLEYGAEKEGYWTGERFMKQVENAANLAEFKYGMNDSQFCGSSTRADATKKLTNMLFLRKIFLSRTVAHGG